MRGRLLAKRVWSVRMVNEERTREYGKKASYLIRYFASYSLYAI